jgi:type II secretory pathway component PulK
LPGQPVFHNLAPGRPANTPIPTVDVPVQEIQPQALLKHNELDLETDAKQLRRDLWTEVELEWLGRSGVELARYIVAMESAGPLGQADSLRKRWAGGPGDPGSPVAHIPLNDYPLGNGSLSIRVVDTDRKLNINRADRLLLDEALEFIGVGATDSSVISDSIFDWRDIDDIPLPNGAESDTYLRYSPPYIARNGFIDHIEELLWIRGVTPESFWGATASGYAAGLNDIFTAVSSGRVNINTVDERVLQAMPGIVAIFPAELIRARKGPDGQDGTADDVNDLNALLQLAGVPQEVPAVLLQHLTVRSLFFEVTVAARLGDEVASFVALLRRNSPRDIALLNLHQR